jgi:2-polyprenyl-3-methyl-5-hydroxy-6-metoxy-1,4-benzoquinol methylase
MNQEMHYSEDRDNRVKETGEVFTPDSLVQQMLDELDIDWSNPPQNKKFLDPTCGSGNFLVALAKRGIPLDMIFGADLMPDNVEKTKERLLQIVDDTDKNREILDKNIVQADALTYDYSFGELAWFEDW